MRTYKEGWPRDKRKLPENIRGYFNKKDDIFVTNGLVFYRNRVIVPVAIRK